MMFCVKCGAALPDGANFCPNCGAPVDGAKSGPEKKEVKTVQFRCKGCGNVMELDPDSPVLHCSVCGSSELILEDEDVTVQRIKSNAYKDVEFGKQKTYKEVELGKKELDIKESNVRFKRHILSYIIIIAGAVGTYLGFGSVSLVGLLIGIIVLIAGIASTRFSKKTAREEKRRPEVIPHNEHYAPRKYNAPGEYNEHHATKEDVELAKVRTEGRNEKLGLIICFILIVFMFGAILVMLYYKQQF